MYMKMFRSIFVRNQILNSSLKKSIRSSIKRCLCTELTNRILLQVLSAQNRKKFAKPLWIIQIRNYADLPKHTKVNLPALSPTMEKGSIMSWAKKEGDKLNEGDLLCEIQSDKAAMGFEAPEDGYLAKIVLPAGAKDVPIGRLLCIIVAEEADVAAFKDFKDDSPAAPAQVRPVAASPAPTAAAPAQVRPVAASPAPTAAAPAQVRPVAASPAPTVAPAAAPGGRLYASPMARRLAALKNIRLAGTGSGLYGSLKSTDLSAMGAAVPTGAGARAAAPTGAGAPAAATVPGAVVRPAPEPGASYVDIPLTSMRATIAERLTTAKQTTPHYQLTVNANVEKMIAMRKRINKKLAAEKVDIKLSMNDFIVKAVAAACKRVPDVNAHWMETFIRQYKNVDISVAVATPTGLVTPILFNCDARGIIDLSKNMKELAARAREGSLQPKEFMGGTVTVSNLGMYDITMFNAIINPPQSLILACGGIQEIVVPIKDRKNKNSKGFRIAKFVTFTASVNHSVIDGAVAAQWMKAFKENIEDPANMIL